MAAVAQIVDDMVDKVATQRQTKVKAKANKKQKTKKPNKKQKIEKANKSKKQKNQTKSKK